jgi:hypothetical protein
MPGLDPRLSGLAQLPLERQLGWVWDRRRFGLEQVIEQLFVHQVGAHEAGEAQRASDGFLGCLHRERRYCDAAWR